MPFIKVSSNDSAPYYVNSDHVRAVTFGDERAYLIFFTAGRHDEPDKLDVSRAAGEYFIGEVEARTAFTTEKIEPLSLASRAAIALRHDFTTGANIDQLAEHLDVPIRVDLLAALGSLIAQNVAIDRNGVYYHRANFTANPDPSDADATKDSDPLADSAR
jgi:hypothetical protein